MCRLEAAEFAKKHKLEGPVAGNFYQVWDTAFEQLAIELESLGKILLCCSLIAH